MKYLGWIVAILLSIVIIFQQVAIQKNSLACKDYREACEDCQKALSIWQHVFYESKGWQ